MTYKTMAQVLSLLETVYGLTLSDEQQRVWYMLLEPLEDEAARQAAIEVCRTSPYPPRPADIWLRAKELETSMHQRSPLILQEPDMSPEERAANLRRVREMVRQITERIS